MKYLVLVNIATAENAEGMPSNTIKASPNCFSKPTLLAPQLAGTGF